MKTQAVVQPAPQSTLTPHDIRHISVVAVCAIPTVERYVRGLPVRDVSRRRIETALRRLGLLRRQP